MLPCRYAENLSTSCVPPFATPLMDYPHQHREDWKDQNQMNDTPTTPGGRTPPASPHRIGVTIDCPDPDSAAAFWERFLGYQRRPHPAGSAYVTVDCPENLAGPPHLTFQRVPEPKTDKARAHLDIFVDHAQPLTRQMLAAGAHQISVTDAGEWTTRVLTDPAGNEFCVIGPD